MDVLEFSERGKRNRNESAVQIRNGYDDNGNTVERGWKNRYKTL